jgi:hypothetical protein
MKEVAGAAEFLRSVPKHFAILKAMDRAKRRVTLLMDGDKEPRDWPLASDAELKLNGWWGRLDQFPIGERVWVWLQLDRVKQPIAISMMADELSEQDIHGSGLELETFISAVMVQNGIRLKPPNGKSLDIFTNKAECFRGSAKSKIDDLKIGEKLYVRIRDRHAEIMQASLVLDSAAFEERRTNQKAAVRKRWIDEGLPGTVTFLHQFSGEMECMLDHEAMRWGRSLKPGDIVSLQASPPIAAVVKQVKPWRERTQLRLVTACADQSDLTMGQRIQLRMPTPPESVDTAVLPPDLDQKRTKEERVDWFLSTIYCSCKIGGDGCTGMFYTLESCNPNACGMPKHMRQVLAEKIDKGMTDKQILEELLKESGPELLRPHLLP